jgi:hypothetical protein
MPRNVASFVAEWFREKRLLDGEGPDDARARAEERINRGPGSQLWELSREDPQQAWALILALLEHAPDEKALVAVGVGPLEDFIHDQGEQYGAWIVAEAEGNQRLRQALDVTWVWASVPDSVREELLQLLSPNLQAQWLEIVAVQKAKEGKARKPKPSRIYGQHSPRPRRLT